MSSSQSLINDRFLSRVGVSLSSRARSLVSTSVQDLQSGLWFYGVQDLSLLRAALIICKNRGEKTKLRILSSKIKKLEKIR